MPITKKRKSRKKNNVGSGLSLDLGIVPITPSISEPSPEHNVGLAQGPGSNAVHLSTEEKAIQEEKKDGSKAGCDVVNLDKEPGININEVCTFFHKLDALSETPKAHTTAELGSDQEMTQKSVVRIRLEKLEEETTQHLGVENEPPLPLGGLMKRKGKTKWTKVDQQFLDFNLKSTSLCEETIYDAVVSEVDKNKFVALVKGSFSVMVYSNHFYPKGFKEPLEQNMPVSCFLKIGDCVKLTATKGKTGHSKRKSCIGWRAQKCWQAEIPETHESTPEAGETEFQSIIISVHNRSIQLTDGTSIHANVMFLFGFHLAHDRVDLKDIFLSGDKISYILHHHSTQCLNTYKVAKAWYGSLPATDGDNPSHRQQFELMDFLKTRCKDCSVPIVMAVCSLNKKAEATEDGFEKLYPDIFSEEGAVGYMVEKNSPMLTERQLNIEKELNCLNDKKETEHKNVWFKGRGKEEYMSFPFSDSSPRNNWARVANEPVNKVSLVDTSTQTHATGEIVCFYSIHNGDSD